MRFVLAAIALIGCGAPPSRVPITMVVRGDADETSRVRSALEHAPPDGIELRGVSVAAPLVTADAPNIDAALEQVHAAYDEPNWQKCIAPISDPSLASRLLAADKRDDAARVVFWRTACLLLKGDEAGAKEVARTMSSRNLDVPNEKSDPAVSRMLHAAALDGSRAPTTTLTITSAGPELTVSFDGRPAMCTTPCPIPARTGTHTIRVEADGRSPETRDVEVSDAPTTAQFDPPLASPDLAARQWVSRWSTSASIDAPRSLHLLADATRARNLVLVVATGGAHPSLSGALAIDGAVRARAHLEAVHGDAAPSLVRELLVQGRVVDSSSIFKKPLFWIVVIAVAGAAAGVTYYFASLPHTVDVKL